MNSRPIIVKFCQLALVFVRNLTIFKHDKFGKQSTRKKVRSLGMISVKLSL